VLALPGGVLGQRFGDRRTVMASLALMVAGGLVTAAAHGFMVAVGGRVLSGIGAVLMNILLAKMVADWFAGRELSTAMGIMLSSWPVGLGVAAATLGSLATHATWRTAIVATALVAALGLALIAFVYRDPPRAGGASPVAARRVKLTSREIALATSGGFAWGCFNASLVAIIAFGPGLLTARGTSLGDAGFVVSLAIWLTMLSVPLGGLVSDRLRRPNVLIVGGCLVAALVTSSIPAFPQPLVAFGLVGLAIGAPPGALMALLPNVVPSERLAAAFGVYYTMYYVVMAVVLVDCG
jgi:MFS family permease